MNYGFVIDNRKCIGCHACSVACKSENDVPLGVYRTWVKYVETGQFPDTRRHFQVTRCNHCANPPCVRICPVAAMYQRRDGIVEFDPSVCIGCKACMQACPYEAIYIDPDSHTAAKCHYCAHRVEIGLEPSCVVVCPEHAILAGDLDDPDSEISRTLASNRVAVRKPEQGTRPKLFYIEGTHWSLHPTATADSPATFLWADVLPRHGQADAGHAPSQPANGRPQSAGQTAQVAYNAQHKIPWHWPVPAYLVTKAVATGSFIALALAAGLGLATFHAPTFLLGGFLSLIFTLITTLFLVLDLEHPRRFLFILTRPQWRSWLARGAFILIGFTIVAGVWWLLEAATSLRWLPPELAATLRPALLWTGALLAAGGAAYTAFLFGQAEGRDLWQSSLLPLHLLVQAGLAGSGLLAIMGLLAPSPADFAGFVRVFFLAMLLLDLALTLMGEFGMSHASEVAARAAHAIRRGRYRRHFWLGGIGLGRLLPLALLLVNAPLTSALAAVAAIAGLFVYEYIFIMAPQEIPNS